MIFKRLVFMKRSGSYMNKAILVFVLKTMFGCIFKMQLASKNMKIILLFFSIFQ
jgi:hypothetical protein